LFQFETTVRIVTIAALHRTFKNFVMERFVEVGLYLGMTANAELRLADFQQMDG
jgi:hypothetical protein